LTEVRFADQVLGVGRIFGGRKQRYVTFGVVDRLLVLGAAEVQEGRHQHRLPRLVGIGMLKIDLLELFGGVSGISGLEIGKRLIVKQVRRIDDDFGLRLLLAAGRNEQSERRYECQGENPAATGNCNRSLKHQEKAPRPASGK
jgi:hypothetical protein